MYKIHTHAHTHKESLEVYWRERGGGEDKQQPYELERFMAY